MLSKLRVVVIEDSALMRLVVSDILKSDGEIEVAGMAANGKEGLELVVKTKPDVVITDLMMPEYDGLFAIRNIMRRCPCPIMVLSGAGDESSQVVFEAMQAGAVDFLEKPQQRGSGGVRAVDKKLVAMVKTISKAKVNAASVLTTKQNSELHSFGTNLPYDILAIGASTGGPGAIEEVVRKLPGNFPVPVVLAQHMPASFITSFANRINTLTPLKVKVAIEGENIRPGTIYIAPGTANMELQKIGANVKVKFNNRTYTDFNNPSVNCLFESVAKIYKSRTISVILTGMGKDGARGMKELKDAGGYTIAQDKNSCVVYGMPGSAVEMGGVTQSVKLSDISSFVVSCFA